MKDLEQFMMDRVLCVNFRIVLNYQEDLLAGVLMIMFNPAMQDRESFYFGRLTTEMFDYFLPAQKWGVLFQKVIRMNTNPPAEDSESYLKKRETASVAIKSLMDRSFLCNVTAYLESSKCDDKCEAHLKDMFLDRIQGDSLLNYDKADFAFSIVDVDELKKGVSALLNLKQDLDSRSALKEAKEAEIRNIQPEISPVDGKNVSDIQPGEYIFCKLEDQSFPVAGMVTEMFQRESDGDYLLTVRFDDGREGKMTLGRNLKVNMAEIETEKDSMTDPPPSRDLVFYLQIALFLSACATILYFFFKS